MNGMRLSSNDIFFKFPSHSKDGMRPKIQFSGNRAPEFGLIIGFISGVRSEWCRSKCPTSLQAPIRITTALEKSDLPDR